MASFCLSLENIFSLTQQKIVMTPGEVDFEYREYVSEVAEVNTNHLPSEQQPFFKEQFMAEFCRLRLLNADNSDETVWLVRSRKDHNLYVLKEVEVGGLSR